MDARQFDALTRLLSEAGSRRGLLAGLAALPGLGGLMSGLPASGARGKNSRKRRGTHKGKRNHKRENKAKDKNKNKNRRRTTAQGDGCWRAGACIPKKGANVSQCDLSSTTSFPGLNCTGCNLSRANLSGVNAQGVNFTRANLSGACLVDADFTGAIFANNTNLYNAIFCNTTMPNGSINNSGCASGTACCPTCLPVGAACGLGNAGTCCGATSCTDGACQGCVPVTCQNLGKQCGSGPDGCGNNVTCGTCPDGQTCADGKCICTPATCQSLGKQCGSWPDGCEGTLQCGTCPDGKSCEDGQCACTPVWANQTIFGSEGTGEKQLLNPFGIAVSSDRLTVWVADTENSRISIWTRPDTSSTNWINQTTFGSFGGGANQFREPQGVAVSSDTLTVWVADSFQDRISIWTRPDTSSTAWTNQTTFGSFGGGANHFNNPAGIAVASDRLTVWVAETDNHRISIWTRPDASSTAWANQITFGSEGSLASQFNNPAGIAVSSDTLRAWVADADNHRISIWTRPDTSSTAWTNQTTFGGVGSGVSQFTRPSSIAVASDELMVWVADSFQDRISIWTRPASNSSAWTNQTTLGSDGSGPKEFSRPFGVAISSDELTVWVADTVNNRISVWALSCPT